VAKITRKNPPGGRSANETRRLDSDWNGVFTKIGVVQGQLKARKKELLSRTVFEQSLGRMFGQKAGRS
jgi:hypothetical protein